MATQPCTELRSRHISRQAAHRVSRSRHIPDFISQAEGRTATPWGWARRFFVSGDAGLDLGQGLPSVCAGISATSARYRSQSLISLLNSTLLTRRTATGTLCGARRFFVPRSRSVLSPQRPRSQYARECLSDGRNKPHSDSTSNSIQSIAGLDLDHEVTGVFAMKCKVS